VAHTPPQVLSFSLAQGLAYVLPTLVGQLLEPCGYSAADAGLAAAVLVVAGVVGNVVAAPFMASASKRRGSRPAWPSSQPAGPPPLRLVGRRAARQAHLT